MRPASPKTRSPRRIPKLPRTLAKRLVRAASSAYVRSTAAPRLGSQRIAVRPEWMDVWPADAVPAGENAVRGTIRDVIYLGETMHVIVTAAGGQEVTVAVRNEGQLTRPLPWKRGDPAVAAWLPEDCQILEEA